MKHPTHFFTCGMEPPRFWWHSDAPEHLSGETLDPLEETLAFPSRGGYVRRKEVALWKFLFDCVRLGHRYMEKQLLSQVVTRLPPFTPKGQFSPIRPRT